MKDASKNVVLLSRRQGTTVWKIRNDRISKDYDYDIEKAKADAQRQIMRWQDVEPHTEFKVEVR